MGGITSAYSKAKEVMSFTRKDAEKEVYKRWYVMTKPQRGEAGFPELTQDMPAYLHVCRQSLAYWARDFQKEGIFPPKQVGRKPRDGIKTGKIKNPPKLPEEMEEAVEDIASIAKGWWTQERINAINEAIFKSSIGTGKGNANAQKLAQQLAGELVEKKEIKFVLSADQYFAIRREAASRIRELPREPDGDRGVSSESPILLSEDGISTEQEHLQEREMAALAIPA